MTYQKEEIEHLLHKGFFDEAEYGRVLGCCEHSLTELFHTSYTSLLGDSADQEKVLLQSPLFSELTDSQKEITIQKGEQSEFLEKDFVIMAPDKGRDKRLFVITAGAVNVCKGDEVLHTKERGDILDVWPLLMDKDHAFTFKVAIKDTTGYWIDIGLLKLLKDENVNFWDSLWKVAAADVIRYFFEGSDALAGVDTTALDNMVHGSPLHFFDANDQERSQIRVTRGLGVLLSGQVVHITDMNAKAAAPAILPQAQDPYLAIEDSVVLYLDLHRKDYHAEKTSHLNPKLAAMMGVAAQSAVPMASEDSYNTDYDTDYASGDEAMDSDAEDGHGDATAGGKIADSLNDQEKALLDGANGDTGMQHGDLQIAAVDSAKTTDDQKDDGSGAATKMVTIDDNRSSMKKVQRHKSTSAMMKRERYSYQIEEDTLSSPVKESIRDLSHRESFEVLKVLLDRHDHLFEHLRKFHVQNVQKQAKLMQIKLSKPGTISETKSTPNRSNKAKSGGSSLFARPSAPGNDNTNLMPRAGRKRTSQSRSLLGMTAPQGPHHEPTATPIIIKPKDMGSPETIKYRKSDAPEIGGWTDDADVVDLNSNADDLNKAMD